MKKISPCVLVVHRDHAIGEALALAISDHLDGADASFSSADDAASFITAVRKLQPDTIVLSSSGCDYVAALLEITELVPRARVLVCGLSSHRDGVISAIRAGASACATAEESLADLIVSIEAMCRGQAICPPSVARILVREVAARRQTGPGRTDRQTPRLTPRETQIIELIENGLSNKQIAIRLTIELQTVKNHVHNILEKLHLGRRAEAARYAREHGLIANAKSSSTRVWP